MNGVQEVGGSNPLAPTTALSCSEPQTDAKTAPGNELGTVSRSDSAPPEDAASCTEKHPNEPGTSVRKAYEIRPDLARLAEIWPDLPDYGSHALRNDVVRNAAGGPVGMNIRQRSSRQRRGRHQPSLTDARPSLSVIAAAYSAAASVVCDGWPTPSLLPEFRLDRVRSFAAIHDGLEFLLS